MTLKPGDINLASNDDLMKVAGGVPYDLSLIHISEPTRPY